MTTIIQFKGGRMAKKRKSKVYDPAEKARIRAGEQERRLASLTPRERADPANWGVNEVALVTGANDELSDTPATRDKVRRITRFDVFGIFRSRGELDPSAYAAVTRLETDIAILHRTTGTAGAGIPGQRNTVTADFSKARFEASKRIEDAEFRTGAHSWKILLALLEPGVIEGRLNNWRAVVQRATGEHNHMAQSALVKAAAQNLAGAYEQIDGRRKRA